MEYFRVRKRKYAEKSNLRRLTYDFLKIKRTRTHDCNSAAAYKGITIPGSVNESAYSKRLHRLKYTPAVPGECRRFNIITIMFHNHR